MMLFGLGNLFYVSILLVNAIAILSEDRFLARSTSPPSTSTSSSPQSPRSYRSPRLPSTSPDKELIRRAPSQVGWGNAQSDPGFGTSTDTTSVKAKMVNLIASVRTLMRIPLIAINTLVIAYELVLG